MSTKQIRPPTRPDWIFKSCLTAIILVVDIIWIALSDFQFDYISVTKVILAVTALTITGWFYNKIRPEPKFEILCVEIALLLSFSAAAAVLSYLVISLNLPLIDKYLLAFDTLIGFDWVTYVSTINANPLLGILSSVIYTTTLVQVTLAVVFFGLKSSAATVSRFVTAVMLSACICIAISAILPAAGALATLQPTVDFLHGKTPIVDLAYKQTFFDLRDGTERFISLNEMKGMIAFPSYHCALSVLLIFAFYSVRFWFWPVALLNIAILFSTPVDGGHHMVDAFGGVVVAAIAWKLAGVKAWRPTATEMLPKLDTTMEKTTGADLV